MTLEDEYMNKMKMDDLTPPLYSKDRWIPIGIGNYYKGQWNHRTMSGNGVYVMPDSNH